MIDEKFNKLGDIYERLYKRFVETDNELNDIPDRNLEGRRKKLDLLQKIAATISSIEDQLTTSQPESDTNDEFAKLLEKPQADETLTEEGKKGFDASQEFAVKKGELEHVKCTITLLAVLCGRGSISRGMTGLRYSCVDGCFTIF